MNKDSLRWTTTSILKYFSQVSILTTSTSTESESVRWREWEMEEIMRERKRAKVRDIEFDLPDERKQKKTMTKWRRRCPVEKTSSCGEDKFLCRLHFYFDERGVIK